MHGSCVLILFHAVPLFSWLIKIKMPEYCLPPLSQYPSHLTVPHFAPHFLMQRYNTREAVCHLLSFSIAKIGKNQYLINGYSVSYKLRKKIKKRTATTQASPQLGGTDTRFVSVTRDMSRRFLKEYG